MAQLINISGRDAIDDPEYRYKMPRLMGKVEGRGNGIKTALVNMRDVANALHRQPDEVTKFFGCELGAQTNWVDATDKSIVNGAHTDMVLQQLLHKYIDIFVLCPNCRLPESHYKIRKGMILHNCLACGAREPADMSHKLVTYILNQHKKDKDKKAKDSKAARKAKEANGDAAGDDKKDKKKKEKKEKKDKKDKKPKKDKADKSEDGASAGSDDGAPAGGDDHSGSGDGPEDSESDEEFEAAATLDNLEVDDAGAFDNCVASIKRHMDDDMAPEGLAEELRTAQTFSAFPVHYRIHLFVAAAFGGAAAVTEATIDKLVPVFKLLVHSPDDQRHVIGAFELLCATRNPALRPYFPVMLKFLYDADVLEEAAVLAWGGEGGRSDEFTAPGVSDEVVEDLAKRAQPFLTWLQEAEEDGSDDEDEE